MYAVEFETRIDNGVVRIPERYSTLQGSKQARIIVMIDEVVEEKTESVFEQFLQNGKVVENLYIPSRDELHER